MYFTGAIVFAATRLVDNTSRFVTGPLPMRAETTTPCRKGQWGVSGQSGAKPGPAEELVPLGLKVLRSDEGYARWAAATMLRGYSDIPEVRSALEQAMTDSDARVRSTAERALQGTPRKPGP